MSVLVISRQCNLCNLWINLPQIRLFIQPPSTGIDVPVM